MTKKECFINEISKMLKDEPEKYFSPDALDYWNALQVTGDEKKGKSFTNNGKLVLGYMQDNKDNYNNLFKAKEIGEGLGISSRTVSGAMRKLVSDGFVEKIGTEPTVYCITDKGIEISLAEV